MKRYALIAILSASSALCELSDRFIKSIAFVESSGNRMAYNAKEGAVGVFQIRQSYLDDANRFMGTDYKLSDMYNVKIAAKVMNAYIAEYSKQVKNIAGFEPSIIQKARIHNGGLDGPWKRDTVKYAIKFLKKYKELK